MKSTDLQSLLGNRQLKLFADGLGELTFMKSIDEKSGVCYMTNEGELSYSILIEEIVQDNFSVIRIYIANEIDIHLTAQFTGELLMHYFVLKGKFNISHNENDYALLALENNFVYTTTFEVKMQFKNAKDYEAVLIVFNKSYLYPWKDIEPFIPFFEDMKTGAAILNHQFMPITPPMLSELKQLLRERDVRPQIMHRFRECKITHLFSLLMGGLLKKPDTIDKLVTTRDIEYVQKAREYILENIHKHFTIAEITRHVGTNRNKLNNTARFIYGCPFTDIITAEKMECARAMIIRRHRRSVRSIADAVGYKNSGKFVVAYEKYFGYRPGEILQRRQ